MRNLQELNLTNGRGEKTTGLSLSSNELISIETFLDIEFPRAYIEFLRFSNGGYPEASVFPFYNDEGSEVNVFFSLTNDKENRNGIIYRTLFLRNIFKEIGLQFNALAIGADGGSNTIYIDCKSDTNKIYIFYRASRNAVVPVADSFEDFINSLTVVLEEDD